jgi:hypothetical protein
LKRVITRLSDHLPKIRDLGNLAIKGSLSTSPIKKIQLHCIYPLKPPLPGKMTPLDPVRFNHQGA